MSLIVMKSAYFLKASATSVMPAVLRQNSTSSMYHRSSSGLSLLNFSALQFCCVTGAACMGCVLLLGSDIVDDSKLFKKMG